VIELPKIIHPHNLKETVVEIKYDSDLPFEVLVGIFFNAFDESYYYTNRPLKQQKISSPSFIQNGIAIQLGVSSIIYNDIISLLIQPNSFVFNVLENYPGWEIYINEIKKAIVVLTSTDKIKFFTRVGLRYISEYEEKDLNECIKYSFSFGLPDTESETNAFKSQFIYKNKRVILNLNNKLPVNKSRNPQKIEIVKLSTIDIDVLDEKIKTNDIEQLYYIIEGNHQIEKEIFFSMIKEEFLKSLNPQY
jgi:uncharacterized protein (TIGR04255 family)